MVHRSECLTECLIANILLQVLEGLAYMHAQKICHRDIKLDNIIYNQDTKKVKIIDFGFAICSKEPLKTMCGTPAYLAPEVLTNREYWGPPADLWAVGVVMYVLLTGFYPCKGPDEKTLHQKIKAATFAAPFNDKAQRASKNARELLKMLLEPDPDIRITAEQALAHPFFINATE
jgi:serine/threonine protein kinase